MSHTLSHSFAQKLTAPKKVFTYRDLIVWQKSIDLVVKIYELTAVFPKEENYRLTQQMCDAVVSIPSNIAEGRHRGTRKDYVNFLRISLGSAAELETQLEISKRLPKTHHLNFEPAESLLSEVMKMLYVMIKKLNP